MAGAAIVAVFVLIVFLRISGLETNPKGITFGLLTGVSYTIGLIFLFFALRSGVGAGVVGSGGRVHTILVITAM